MPTPEQHRPPNPDSFANWPRELGLRPLDKEVAKARAQRPPIPGAAAYVTPGSPETSTPLSPDPIDTPPPQNEPEVPHNVAVVIPHEPQTRPGTVDVLPGRPQPENPGTITGEFYVSGMTGLRAQTMDDVKRLLQTYEQNISEVRGHQPTRDPFAESRVRLQRLQAIGPVALLRVRLRNGDYPYPTRLPRRDAGTHLDSPGVGPQNQQPQLRDRLNEGLGRLAARELREAHLNRVPGTPRKTALELLIDARAAERALQQITADAAQAWRAGPEADVELLEEILSGLRRL